MKIVRAPIPFSDLAALAEAGFGDMVKAVVDVSAGIMAVDGELHADQEALLIEQGSRQRDLWGINLYPGIEGPEWLEYDSMINLRPASGNRTRGVEDPALRERIRSIVEGLVTR